MQGGSLSLSVREGATFPFQARFLRGQRSLQSLGALHHLLLKFAKRPFGHGQGRGAFGRHFEEMSRLRLLVSQTFLHLRLLGIEGLDLLQQGVVLALNCHRGHVVYGTL